MVEHLENNAQASGALAQVVASALIPSLLGGGHVYKSGDQNILDAEQRFLPEFQTGHLADYVALLKNGNICESDQVVLSKLEQSFENERLTDKRLDGSGDFYQGVLNRMRIGTDAALLGALALQCPDESIDVNTDLWGDDTSFGPAAFQRLFRVAYGSALSVQDADYESHPTATKTWILSFESIMLSAEMQDANRSFALRAAADHSAIALCANLETAGSYLKLAADAPQCPLDLTDSLMSPLSTTESLEILRAAYASMKSPIPPIMCSNGAGRYQDWAIEYFHVDPEIDSIFTDSVPAYVHVQYPSGKLPQQFFQAWAKLRQFCRSIGALRPLQ